jgi:hypothetical protein
MDYHKSEQVMGNYQLTIILPTKSEQVTGSYQLTTAESEQATGSRQLTDKNSKKSRVNSFSFG